MQQRLSRIAALAPARRREPVQERANTEAGEDDRLAPLLGATIGRNRYGEHLIARQWYATPETCEPSAETLRLLLGRRTKMRGRTRAYPDLRAMEAAVENAADFSRWLFLDTETTGLAGGTGTYAFLVGLAWWDAGGLQTEQLFMRDHGEEYSVLLEIAERLRERPVLVTFNGKSFDWPLLETRYRMTRSMETPRVAAHLDFLHPARQLWRWQLSSVRLADLERHVLGGDSLGWSRGDDIDSSRIPEFYFDYLRGGAAEPLAGVFRHNRMDLRGLGALAGRVSKMIEESCDGAGAEASAGQEPLELYGLSRYLERRGEAERARTLYERVLEAGLPAQMDRNARHELARLAKRQADFGRAAALWKELMDHESPSFEACEQMAIHFERRAKDLTEAARVTRLGLRELRRAQRLGMIPAGRHAQLAERFNRRLARIEGKIGIADA